MGVALVLAFLAAIGPRTGTGSTPGSTTRAAGSSHVGARPEVDRRGIAPRYSSQSSCRSGTPTSRPYASASARPASSPAG
jgi:hypothetical protein